MGRLLKTFGIYFAGTVINRLMGFIVLSVATFAITNQGDIGYFTIASNAVNIIMTMVCLQAWMAVIRFVFDYNSKRYKRQVISTGYFIEGVTFLIYTIGFIIAALGFHIRDALELYILSFGYVFVQSTQFACRGLGQNRLFVSSGVFGSLMQLIFSIIFIFGFHMTSSALILAMAMSYIGQGWFIEMFLKSIRRFRLHDVNFTLAKKMLKYCIPTAMNYAVYWVNNSANTIIIGACINQAATGLFTAAFKMNSLIGIVVMAFNFAFQEYSFSIHKSQNRNQMYNFMFDAFVRFISCGMLFLLPVTNILFSLIIGPAYGEAQSLIPLLYVGSFFDSTQLFISSIMQAEKRVNLMFVSQLVGALLTVGVMLSTIWFIGLQSAGLAMIVCFLSVCIIRIIGLRPQVKLRLQWTYFVHYIIVFCISAVIFLHCNQLINFLYAIPLAAYCLFCLRNIIKEFLRQILKKANNKKLT